MSGKNEGLDMQRMVVPKTAPAHSRQDFNLRVVKTDSNAESHAGAKTNPRCMTYGYVEGCHRGKWLAHNG